MQKYSCFGLWFTSILMLLQNCACYRSGVSEIRSIGHEWGLILRQNAAKLRTADHYELSQRFDFQDLDLSVEHTHDFATQIFRTDRDLVASSLFGRYENFILLEQATHQAVPRVVLILEVDNKIMIRANEHRIVIDGEPVETEWTPGRVYEAWLSPEAALNFMNGIRQRLAVIGDQVFICKPGYPEVASQGYSLTGIRVKWGTEKADLVIYGWPPDECIVESDPCVEPWVEHEPGSACDLPAFELMQYIIATWGDAFCERTVSEDMMFGDNAE